MNSIVEEYLKKKYGDDYQGKAEADYNDQQDNINTGSVVSSIGAALAGRDPNASNDYYNQLKKSAKENTIGKIESDRNQFVKNKMESSQLQDMADKDQIRASENDLNNPMIQSYRAQMAKLGVQIPEGMTLADIKRNYGDAKSLNEIKMRSQIDFQNQKQLRGMDQGFREKESALDRDLKRELEEKQLGQKNSEKAEKQKLGMTEVNDRYTNMKDSIKSLKALIDKTSGGDITGPENKQMDQYITSIATDMAKLVDPQSVARESEVASFKQMLFEPGFLNTAFTRGSTLQSVVDNFESMVDKRLDTAYKVRGLEKSDMMKQASEQNQGPKMVKMKAPDGSIRSVREDQVQAALQKGGELLEMNAGF